jgi:putative endonuclease
METINDKAMHGISTYLTRSGFDIIEEGWAHGKDSIDFIAREDDDLVFIATKTADGGSDIPAEKVNRKSLERVAAAYLAANLDIPEGSVRFDIVSMLILGESRALIRHHRSALSESGTTEV